MPSPRSPLILLAIAVMLPTPAIAAATHPTGFSAAVRYAGPHGTGTACTTGQPCSITTALNSAPADGDVVINPGRYGTASHPIATTLGDNGHTLDIHGAAGHPLPVIISDASPGFELGDSRLSRVEIDDDQDQAVFSFSGTIDHVIARESTFGGTACVAYKVISDSACIATGANGIAIDIAEGTSNPTTVRVTIRGVTAEAPAPQGEGLVADANGKVTLKVHAVSDIFHGGGDDVVAQTDATTATAAITTSHCDYATKLLNASVGSPSITDDHTSITTRPVFRSAAAGDYREAASSPTVNKGAGTRAGSDLAGNPRTLGPRVDIGAYELPQKATARALKVTKRTTTTAHLSVRINPEGLPTKVHLVAKVGHRHVSSMSVSAGHGRSARTLHLVLHGLARASSYKVHAVAHNSAGNASSAAKTVHTKNR